MTQAGSGKPVARQRPKAPATVYTALAFIAFAVLVAGVAYLWIRTAELYESPMSIFGG